MKRQRVFLPPPPPPPPPPPLDGMLVHRRVTPSTHLYTWVERGTIKIKCIAQEHNAVPRPALEPGPPDPESSALTIRPQRLPLCRKNPRTICQGQVNFALRHVTVRTLGARWVSENSVSMHVAFQPAKKY